MARDQELVVCPPGQWTQLTNDDVTTLTFQVVTGSVRVRATVGATPPAADAQGYVYHSRPADPQKEDSELALNIEDFSTAAGANRVYAKPINGRTAKVIVDHG